MRIILILALLLFNPSAHANECLRNASDQELLEEISSRMGNGGLTFDEKVSASCLNALYEAYSPQPGKSTLLNWANQCRSKVTGNCSLVQTAPDGQCTELLVKFYPYEPSQSTLRDFANACEIKRFICSR